MSIWKYYCMAILNIALIITHKNSFSQCSSSQSQLTLSIDFTLDNYPDEDAWKLINLTTGVPVDSTCFGDYSNGGIITDTLCVNPGDDYALLVLDDYGDGLDGAVYQLSYTYGNSIGSVSSANKAIPYSHCGATYSTNTIVDSINFKAGNVPPPPCQIPSDLRAYSWTTNSAKLNWTENDTASEWQIEYDTSGFTLGTGIRFAASSNPTTISGLAIATEYDFYVRSICSPGDTSAWAGPEYFKSACNSITSYPYNDNFNDTSTSCWRRAAEIGETQWELATGTASDISAPYEGSGFMEKDYENSEALLVSPPFDLSSLNTSGQISLFLHRHNQADPTDQYVVFVSDTPKIAGADTLLHIYSKTTTAPSVPSKGWYEYFADIPSKYLNQTVYVIIQGITEKNIFSYDLGVDMFTLKEIPTCPSPSTLSTNSATDSSATLSWTENGNANSWEIEYGLNGFNQGNGTRVIVNSNPFILSNLSANADYEFYVRSICAAGDSSIWNGPFDFETKCNAVSSLPFNENFDGSLNSNGEWDCWKIVNVDGNETWRQGNQFLNYVRSAPFAALGMGNNNDHLISPKIVLPNKPIVLTLWDKVEHSTFNNIYEILVSTTGDSVSDFTDTVTAINAYDTAWTKRTVYLSAYAGQEIYVSIHQKYSAADYYGFGIDDFKIDTAAQCVEPSHIDLASLLDSSAVVNWTENGTSTQWEVQYGPKGFNMGNGSSDLANNPSYHMDSLNANSSYDFYVRSVCAVNDSSTWVGPFSFKTMCAPYAVPYEQDFENNTNIPTCWRQGVENIESWLFEDSVTHINHVGNLGVYNSTTISGDHFAYVDDSSPHGTTTSLLSPLFDLQNVQKPLLSFFRMSNNENQRNVDFEVEVWDGSNWNTVFFSDTNSLGNEWEQIILPLDHLNFVDEVQIRFTVEENNGQDVADDVTIDDFFIGSSNDFIPYYPIADINNVDANGVADSLGIEMYTSGIVGNITFFPYTTQTFTLVDTTGGEQEGIYVYSPSTTNYTPEVGDFIVLKGTVDQVNGMQVFQADSIRLEEKNRAVGFRSVAVLDESTESELVILDDLLITNIQNNQNWIDISLSDGMNTFFVKIDTATDVDDQLTLQVGDGICLLKGVGMQDDSSNPFLGGYYLSPISGDDFVFQPKVSLGNDTIICDTTKFDLDAGAGFESYLWNTGDTNQIVPVTSSDSLYTVTVFDQNGCSATDSIKVNVDVCTGVEEVKSKTTFVVYPNPTKGMFNIKLTGFSSKKIHLEIMDISGKKIKDRVVELDSSTPELRIDMSSKSKGVYFIQLEVQGQVYHQKLILQ